MTPIEGPFARLEDAREELAKEWLMRMIERASLDELRELPAERALGDLPELIGAIARSAAAPPSDPYALPHEQAARAGRLVGLRSGARDIGPEDVARDLADLQTVLIAALRDQPRSTGPDGFAEAVQRVSQAVGAVQAATMDALLRTRSRELESQANTDPLTGLDNLRSLQRSLGRMIDVHRRYRRPFALLLIDLDGLKRINDAHGHAAGDRVLIQVGLSLRRSVRSVDVAARLGGDEFCVLAPEQDLCAGAMLAERLAGAVRAEVVSPEGPPVGVSIGVTACPEHGDEGDVLIDVADRAMYRAKAGGENLSLGDPTGSGVTREVRKGI